MDRRSDLFTGGSRCRASIRSLSNALCITAAALSVSCFQPAGNTGSAAGEPDLWRQEFHVPTLPKTLEGLDLEPFSTWGVFEDKEALAVEKGVSLHRLKPDPMSLAFFGLGNGKVFCFEGGTYPLNTLHDLIGPDMQKGSEGFFADVSLEIGDDPNTPDKFSKEWIFRTRYGAVNVTKAISGGREAALYTLDFAPAGEAAASIGAHNAIIRIAFVENLSESRPLNATVFTKSGKEVTLDDDFIVEKRNEKTLWYTCLDSTCKAEPKTRAGYSGGLSWNIAGLAPGAVEEFSMVFMFESRNEPIDPAALLSDVRTRGWGPLLAETLDWWKSWMDRTTRIVTVDQRVNDLLDGIKVTCKLQQTRQGAATPMSHYTSTWTRDQMGWFRYYLAIGAYEDAAAILDYAYLGALYRGGLYNAVDSNLDPDGAPEPPDWRSLPKGSDRTAAEQPSYIPIMYDMLYRSTSDLKRAQERFDYLEYCMNSQLVNENGLLGFSGDETYRTAMAVGLGLDAAYDFQSRSYSANSSFLFIAGVKALTDLASAIDSADRTASLRESADRVNSGLADYYWNEQQGFWAPFLDMETLEPADKPFEDVNTKPVWLGLNEFNEEVLEGNMQALLDSAYRGDGFVVSYSDQDVELLGIDMGQGIYTGMSQGYVLYYLAALNHPLAEQSFNALGMFADRSGNYAEAHAFQTQRPIQPFYFPTGGQGELWARFRPWEGGINAEAAFFYLTGRKLDCPGRKISLFPRLPNSWPRLRIEGMALCPGDRLDINLEEQDNSLVLSVGPRELSSPYRLDLQLQTACETSGCRVDLRGSRLERREYTVQDVEWSKGEKIVRMNVTIEPGETTEIRVR